jgi:hypothetical protein
MAPTMQPGVTSGGGGYGLGSVAGAGGAGFLGGALLGPALHDAFGGHMGGGGGSMGGGGDMFAADTSGGNTFSASN